MLSSSNPKWRDARNTKSRSIMRRRRRTTEENSNTTMAGYSPLSKRILRGSKTKFRLYIATKDAFPGLESSVAEARACYDESSDNIISSSEGEGMF